MSDEEGASGSEPPDGPDEPAAPTGSGGPRDATDATDATTDEGPADSTTAAGHGGASGTDPTPDSESAVGHGAAAGGDGSGPRAESAAPENPTGLREWLRWLRTTDREAVVYGRELVTSVGTVLAIGLLLFLVSGVWPPMVAVESSSMEPNMGVGDLVFVMEEDRLSPEYAHETGVVTHRIGEQHGYTKFGKPGDVIIYRANGQGGTPIIHRAMFWVDEGENWCDKADPQHVGSTGADSECAEADHSGFITKGDNAMTNGEYDQVNGLSAPVKPEWVVGTAEASIPFLGYVKLCTSSGPCFLAGGPVGGASAAPGGESRATPAGAPSTAPGDAPTALTAGGPTERPTATEAGPHAPTAGPASADANASSATPGPTAVRPPAAG